MEADCISYNSAITSCEKAAEWEMALSLLASFKSKGLQPDIVSFDAPDASRYFLIYSVHSSFSSKEIPP